MQIQNDIQLDGISLVDAPSSGNDYVQALYNWALAYLARGWSVIPVRGSAAEVRTAKQPPIGFKWTEYQNRYATQEEVADWFFGRGYKGLAIVAGTLSRLAIMDCDNDEFSALVQNEAPHLTNTFTVRTASKQLPHFYFSLPDEFVNINSHHVAGKVDFQAEGTYVVTYPTIIGEKQYKIVNNTTLHTLTAGDLNLISTLLGTREKTVVTAEQKPRRASAEMLLCRFQEFLQTLPRNASLHKAAVYAASHGWAEGEIMSVLGKVFVGSPAPEGHEPERQVDRWHEAKRTIRSAFNNQPFAASTYPTKTEGNGLPNTVREKLLQLGDAHTPRLLDAFLMEAVESNTVFTQKDAIAIGAKYGIGRNNVIKVLNESSISSLFLSSSCSLLSFVPFSSTQCYVPPQIPKLNSVRGRKPKQYVMPTIQQICDEVGVQMRPGDTLKANDLKSPKDYRIALHREFVRRNPGIQITRIWMAKRLNVAKFTLQTYDKAANVIAKSVKEIIDINQENLRMIPECPNGWPRNIYLLVSGRRCPLWRADAITALNLGYMVKLVRQYANKYYPMDEEHVEDYRLWQPQFFNVNHTSSNL